MKGCRASADGAVARKSAGIARQGHPTERQGDMKEQTDRKAADVVRPFFDAHAADWDDVSEADPRKIAAIVTLAGITAGCRVADIACGTGVLTAELLSRDPSCILGVDFSREMIAAARRKYADARVRWLVSDIFDVDINGLDAAVLYNAYPHFPEKRPLVEHVHAMLREGGRFSVAHGASREEINRCHGGSAMPVSWPLRSAKEEAKEFQGLFAVDILVDSPDLYVVSGIRI